MSWTYKQKKWRDATRREYTEETGRSDWSAPEFVNWLVEKSILPQSYARPVAVFGQEHDPGGFEGGADSGDGGGAGQALPLFKVNQRSAGDTCPVGNVALLKAEDCTGCAALSGGHAESDLKSDLMSDIVSDSNPTRRP